MCRGRIVHEGGDEAVAGAGDEGIVADELNGNLETGISRLYKERANGLHISLSDEPAITRGRDHEMTGLHQPGLRRGAKYSIAANADITQRIRSDIAVGSEVAAAASAL